GRPAPSRWWPAGGASAVPAGPVDGRPGPHDLETVELDEGFPLGHLRERGLVYTVPQRGTYVGREALTT
ncbi:hypothetical protein ACFQ0D_35545, partial [Micromonospora zhanjiangensis]